MGWEMKTQNKSHQKRQRRALEQGVGLLEAVFSILIASIGLLALAQLFGVAAALNTTSRSSTLMARAAQESIEIMRSKSFSAIVAGTTNTVYQNHYNVSTLVENTGLILKIITVTVEDRSAISKTNEPRKAVFVVYLDDAKAAEGPLYNRLVDPDKYNSGSANSFR